MTDRRRNQARRPSGATASRPSTVERQQPAPGTRRRRLVVGPGLIIALLASGGLVWGGNTKWGVRDDRGREELFDVTADPDWPTLREARELKMVAAAGPLLASTPGVADEFAVRLADRFDRETAGARAALRQATDDFARHMEGKAGKRVLLPDVQEQTASVSQLSRQLAAARRAVWARLSPVLTAEQRARWYQQTAREELMWGNALNPLDPRTTLKPATDGGSLLNGAKSFCTGAQGSDLLLVSATAADVAQLQVAVFCVKRVKGQVGETADQRRCQEQEEHAEILFVDRLADEPQDRRDRGNDQCGE